MFRVLSKVSILLLLLASLQGATFLSSKKNFGSGSNKILGSISLKPGPARIDQGFSGSSDLHQYAAAGHVLGFRTGGIVIASGSHALRVDHVNAMPVPPAAEGTPSKSAWGRGPAPAFDKVTYRDLWDGVTVVYEKTESAVVKSTYYIQPGDAGPSQLVDKIRLRYNVPVKVDPNGNLVLSFATGEMRETRPVAWQEISGKKVVVEADYRLIGEREVGFKVGPCDSRYPLVIDPTLSWNTFLGVSVTSWRIGVDARGNSYVTGSSNKAWGSPISPFAGSEDAYVAKLDANGALQWNTFLGGSGFDTSFAIAVDASGNSYVTGYSYGTWGSPVRPFNDTNPSGVDVFVAKLDTNGGLQWNTFLGASGFAYGYGIAIDTSGNSYVTGDSYGTWGSPVRPHNGDRDVFVAKLDTNGGLQWNTFLGCSAEDWSGAIAIDTSGNSYVTGISPETWGLPLRPNAGYYDAFVAKLDTNGALQWNTFLGGSGYDPSSDIATDTSGNSYVLGYSDGTWGSPLSPFAGYCDAFVAKLETNGALQWNTFLGGSDFDDGRDIATDTSGNSYVLGYSYGTWGLPQWAYAGGTDAFIAKLNANGALQWNTFLGGPSDDIGFGFAMDTKGNGYATGWSTATWGSPIWPFNEDRDQSLDVFVAKISMQQQYAFYGFDQPIDNKPTVNSVKAGSTIPVKWLITDLDGTPISDPSSFKSLTSSVVNCDSFSGEPAAELEQYSTGSSGLQYLGGGCWQFDWKTTKGYAGQCRIMTLSLADGSTHTASFKFK